MSINIQCKNCSRCFSAPDDAAGRVGRCPKCGSRIAIPDEIVTADIDHSEIVTAPPLQSSNGSSKPANPPQFAPASEIFGESPATNPIQFRVARSAPERFITAIPRFLLNAIGSACLLAAIASPFIFAGLFSQEASSPGFATGLIGSTILAWMGCFAFVGARILYLAELSTDYLIDMVNKTDRK